MFVTNNRYRNLDQYTRHQSVFRRLLNDYIFAIKALFFIVAAIASVALLIVSFGVAITTLLSFYVAYKVLRPVMQLVSPIVNGFYSVVRFALTPLKFFNDNLEALIINTIAAGRISPTTGRRIVLAVYLAELIIGSSLMASFLIAPVAAFASPAVGGVISGAIYAAMLAVNTIKLSSWIAERFVNFSASVRNLEWRPNWTLQFLARQRHEERIQERIQQRNREGNNGRFATAWKNAIASRDLSEALQLLQGSYELDDRVVFTDEMNKTYVENGTAAAYGSSLYEDLCCPISACFMQIPVYIESTDSKGKPVKQYFDFIQLLKALETTNKNPLNREVIVDLTKIKYDAEKYDAIQNLLKNAREDNNSPVLLSGGPRKRSASGENSVVEEDGELDMTILPNRALSNTTMGFGN